MATLNKDKTPPKNDIKFSIALSDEQKEAKTKIIETPFNFILGKAGSGKTLLAVQIALFTFRISHLTEHLKKKSSRLQHRKVVGAFSR